MSGLRIGFMGTPDFALSALSALFDANKNIVAIYSQPPRPKGRGHRVQPSPVHQFGIDHDIPVFHPKSLKSKEAQEEFAALDLDIAVVAAYGLLLPKAVLDAPKYGCVNIHASLLPRWRGASPIQHAILHGDAESGVTLMQMDEGLDTGPMISKQALDLDAKMTASKLHDALADMGGRMIVEYITALENGKIYESEVQNAADSTYAPLLNKVDGRIDWTQNAAAIDRQVRALNPWPGVWAEQGNVRFKILEAGEVSWSEYGSSDAQSGQILSQQGHVECGGHSVLQIYKIQPAGKKAMDFVSALNGGLIHIARKFV